MSKQQKNLEGGYFRYHHETYCCYCLLPPLILQKIYRMMSKHGSRKGNLGFGKVMQPFRLSLVGAMQGPDVF
jgi:hypothetical protein